MDEIKLKILAILEAKAYQKVGIEVFEKEIPGQDLYRHFEYLEQKGLIKLFKIGPFSGTSIPQILSAILTAKGEDAIKKAMAEVEHSLQISEGKSKLKDLMDSPLYQSAKDIIIPILQMIFK